MVRSKQPLLDLAREDNNIIHNIMTLTKNNYSAQN